jgi:hypothetical protein
MLQTVAVCVLAVAPSACPRGTQAVDARPADGAAVAELALTDRLLGEGEGPGDGPTVDALAQPPPVRVFEDPGTPRSVTCNGIALPPRTDYKGCSEHDLGWAVALYGLQLQRATAAEVAQAGGTVYRLVELFEANGPITFKTFVLDANGAPLQHEVTYCWHVVREAAGRLSCAPEGGTTTVTAGADGAADLVVGGAAYAPCGTHGPYGVRISRPGAASDRVLGLGWLLGTNHLHLNLVFQRMKRGEHLEEVARCPFP